jgi:ABC-type transporter Mla subunit MlaD
MAVTVKTRERLVGLFVLLTIAAVAAILLGVVSRERFFRKEILVSAAFDQRFNLSRGSVLLFEGFEVGHIHQIELAGPYHVDVKLAVDARYARFISRRCTVSVETSPIGGLVSDNVLLVPPADSAEESSPAVNDPIQEGSVLRFERGATLINRATEIIDLAKREILPSVTTLASAASELLQRLNAPTGELRTLLGHANDLSANIGTSLGNLDRTMQGLAQDAHETTTRLNEMLTRTNAIAEGLERGDGVAGTILRDAHMKDDLQHTSSDVRAMVAQLNESLPKLLSDVQSVMASLKTISSQAEQASARVPVLLDSAQMSMVNANDVLAAVKNHWLLRGYVPEVKEAETLSRSPRLSPSVGGRP